MELDIYYKHLFPIENYVKWLSYNNKPDIYQKSKNYPGTYLSRREISMTLPQDIYVRYQTIDINESKKSQAETFKEMLSKKQPIKIDIGAVYNNSPKYKSSRHAQHLAKGEFVIPKEKEIVFDIDMTDYDPVRLCCDGAKICEKCWPLMRVACKILKFQLERSFGFKHLLFVYSGRRGVHCWVADKKAREYPAAVRTALAQYLQLLSGGGGSGTILPPHGACENKKIKVYNETFNKCEIYQNSISIIDQYFEEYLSQQGFFEGPKEKFWKITGLILNEKIRNSLNEKLANISDDNPDGRIACFLKFLSGKPGSGNPAWTVNFLHEIKLQLCYPRLDINVSKDVHHLLKSPFSIHPKTGNVCVPFSHADIDNFNPFTDTPKLGQIVKQLNEPRNAEAYKNGKDSEHFLTDLSKFNKIFGEFVEGVCAEEDGIVREYYEERGLGCSPEKKKKMEMLKEENMVVG